MLEIDKPSIEIYAKHNCFCYYLLYTRLHVSTYLSDHHQVFLQLSQIMPYTCWDPSIGSKSAIYMLGSHHWVKECYIRVGIPALGQRVLYTCWDPSIGSKSAIYMLGSHHWVKECYIHVGIPALGQRVLYTCWGPIIGSKSAIYMLGSQHWVKECYIRVGIPAFFDSILRRPDDDRIRRSKHVASYTLNIKKCSA